MRTLAKIAWCLALPLAVSGGLMAQDQSADQSIPALAPPYKTVTFAYSARKGATAPFFSHGYLIQFQRGTPETGVPTIYLYNSDGDLEQQFSVWPDGTQWFFLTSVDVGAGQQLAYAGRQTKTDGSIIGLIASADLDGKNPRYISTGNYLATQIALADDGSLWAVGEEFPSVTSPEERWENYDMLRHYSASGVLLGQFLPRWDSSVAYVTATPDSHGHYKKLSAYDKQGALAKTYGYPNWGPAAGYTTAWKRTRQVYLRSSGGITLLYDGTRRLICEYGAESQSLSCSSIEGVFSQNLKVTGFGITSDGDIFASMVGDWSVHDALRGLFVLTPLDKGGANQWTVVPGTPGHAKHRGDFLNLLGADESSLVYRQRDDPGPVIHVHVCESLWER